MIKKKPKFQRQNAHRKKRVAKKSWRSPRGVDSKQRRNKKYQPNRPNIGYGTGRKTIEILIANVNELEKFKNEKKLKIRSGVGRKKRQQIIEKAKEMKINILNA